MIIRTVKRKWRRGNMKLCIHLMLAFLLVVSYIPLFPALVNLTSKAYAATNMRIEPSEINPEKGEMSNIIFSFNAADDGQEEHVTNINLCSPQANGSSPVLGKLIKSGVYKTKNNKGEYIVHNVDWDGKIGGVPLEEGRYAICISPSTYNGVGVFYGQMASFEILGGEAPIAPTELDIKPAASGNASIISGSAATGTTLDLELYYPAEGDRVKYEGISVNAAGQWSENVELRVGSIAHITARAKKDSHLSGYSEPLEVLRVPTPAFSVNWEAIAAFYYNLYSVEATKEKAIALADINNSATATGNVSGLTSILLTEPESSDTIKQEELSQFTELALADRLRIVNPTGQTPVDPARGDFVYATDAITLQALMPLQFSSNYLSRDSFKGVSGLGWHHSYEWQLTPINDGKIEVMSPDGSRFEYIPLSGGRYLTPRGTDWTLSAQAAGEYTLTPPKGDHYNFNSFGLLQSIKDINGNIINFSYQGKLLKNVNTSGASLTLSYDGAGKLISVGDDSGRVMEYHYDPATGDLLTITDVEGFTTKFTYDNSHHVLSVTDAKGTATMSVTYDTNQRVTSFTDFYGETSTSSYEGRVAPVVRGEEETSDELGIDPNHGQDIPESDEVILSGTMNNLAHAPAFQKVEGLKPVIANYLADSIHEIEGKRDGFISSAISVGSGDISAVQKAISDSSVTPAVVSTGSLNVEESVTFGSPSKPVVLIVDGMNTNKDITVRVYGTLILKHGLNANTKLVLDVQKVGGLYGNLWSGGTIHLNNDSSVTVADTLQTGSLTYNSGGLTIDTRRMLIAGDLSINTRVEMNIAQEIVVGGIVSNNQTANLTVTGGDLFVRDNVSVNNNLNVKTGGLFAMGGDMTPNQTPIIHTGVGAGKTILIYPQSATHYENSKTVKPSGLASSITTTENKTKWKNALGQETTYTWNNHFLVAKRQAANGSNVKYQYDSSDRLSVITNGNGNTSKLFYDPKGNLIQMTDENGNSSLTRYNAMNRPIEEIDALGNQTTYEYDGVGNLSKTADALGHTSTILRDNRGIPVSVLDAKGETTVYTNDAEGFAKEIKDPSGHTTVIERDSLHRTIGVIDEEGKLQVIQYDAKDRAIAVTNALGHTKSVTYDANGNPEIQTDEAGAKTTYSYNVYRLSGSENALQHSTANTYDALGNVIEERDEAGKITSYSYDNVGQLSKVIDAAGQANTYTYDNNGNVLTQKDNQGNITSYTYSKRNELLSVTDPMGSTTRYRYDAEGNKIKETNALGNSTWYDYDELGQLVAVTDALGATTEYQYDDSGNQIAWIDSNHSVWQTKYDSRGLEVGSINPLNEETFITRNSRGLMTEFKNASGQKTTYEYDALGRNTLIRNALGNETAYQYDALGNVENVLDANVHETAFNYDELGRLTKVKNTEGNITRYSYDESGNLLDKTNALGSVTAYHYDELNRVVESINPLKEKTSFTYDSNSNLLEVIEPDSLTISYTYNAGNQLAQIKYGDGRSVKYDYDIVGRRLTMQDSTGTTRYTYDALNRPTSVIDPRGNNVRYEWTATGQRSRIIYPDNSVVSYSYDKLDRIKSVTDAQNQTTSYQYDENGRLVDKLLPNAGQSTYTYDGIGQLLEMKHQAPGGALLEQLTYVFDPVGNKLRSERKVGGSDEDNPSGAPSPVDISDYAYDALDQLVRVQKQNGSTVAYSYDTVGNRLSKEEIKSGITTTERYTYDAANKLIHFEKGNDYKDYTYDLRGNLLEVAGLDSEATLRLLTVKASANANLSVTESVYSDTDPLAPILPDADLDSGVSEDVYGVDEALDPESMMMNALGTDGPQVLESNDWDASNRLIRNTNLSGDVTSYQYDGDGNRVSMRTTLGDGSIQNAYPSGNPTGARDGWEPQYKKKQLDLYFTNDITMSIPQPLTTTGADGQNWKQSYVYGAGEERINMSYLVSGDESNDWEPSAGASGTSANSTPKTLYYLNDALGSVIGLEAQDGSISARYHYDEFGVAVNPEKFDLNWSGPDNLFGYTSLGYDYYSGYSHAQARDFDSSVGRFISEDTYEGQIDNPLSQNLYTYATNNPLIYIDPTGHWNEKLGFNYTINEMKNQWTTANTLAERNYWANEAEQIRKQALQAGYSKADIMQSTDKMIPMEEIMKQANQMFPALSAIQGFTEDLSNYVENHPGEGVALSASMGMFRAGKIAKLEAGLNFTVTTTARMENASRFVPVQTLISAIKYGKEMDDARGSTAKMFYTVMYKNGQAYNLEVLYDKGSNTVFHFVYTRDAITRAGLPAIPKK
jgi:RHS repeat-associated protein